MKQQLYRFDRAWQSGKAPPIEEFLPPGAPGTDPARRRLLEELIQIDLEYRWRFASQPMAGIPPPERLRLEDYSRRYPELGRVGQLSLQLIGQEYEVRRCWGDRPGHDEYQSRFAHRAREVRETLARIDAKLTVEQRKASQNIAAARLPDARPGRPFPSEKTPVADAPGSPEITVAALVNTIRDGEILAAPQLNEVLRGLAGKTADPRVVARELLRRAWLTPFQANQLLSGRGQELCQGPYLLLERLGEGGAGQVFKARHRKLDRLVALKFIRKDLLDDSDMVARFYREMEVVGQLDHPNIIHAYDAGPIGFVHVLVMEYVEGTDLSRLVKKSGPLPLAQACDYVRQAALGLQYAHERKLVHRDIKPANLMLVSGGAVSGGDQRSTTTHHSPLTTHQVKILDLGLARLCRVSAEGAAQTEGEEAGARTLTPQGSVLVMGTTDYLAPEQALDFHTADIRADIYSLGCTLCYLLTGRPPFPDGTMAQKLIQHQQAELPDFQKLRSDVPSGLIPVLRKMLAKRPADRYQRPADVARDLQPWAGPQTSSLTAPRRLAIRIGVALLAASLLLVAFLAFRSASSPTAAAALKKLHDLKKDRPQDVDDLRKGIIWLAMDHPGTPEAVEAAAMFMELPSPLDKLKVAPAQRPTGGAAKDLGFVVLGDKSMEASCVALSPNCGLVASGGGDKRIHVWDSVSGDKLYGLEGHSAAVTGVTFAPNGKTLASMSDDQTVKLWDLTTHRARPFEGPKGPFVALAFSPDGKTLAVAEKNAVKLGDVTDGRQAQSIAVPGVITAMAYAPNGKAIAVTRAAEPPIILEPMGNEPVQLPFSTLFYRVVYAPDSQILALGGRTTFGPAVVSASRGNWAQATCESPFTSKDTRPAVFLAFVPGGKQLVWIDEFGFILRWQLGATDKAECLGRCPCRQGIPNPVLAADGRHLAIADGAVWILRLAK